MNTRIHGECHCGNLSFDFETDKDLQQIRLRSCDCGFCRAHATRCFSDPAASAVIRIREEALLQRYRFGHQTTDFLICIGCGVYLGAVINDGSRYRSTLNFRLAPERELPAGPVSYRGQSKVDRVEQRLARFTPTRIITEI